MEQIETKLQVLIDSMEKKEQALEKIAGITENQGTVLNSALGTNDKRAFMVEMNTEKQSYIHTVLQCDSLFETVLKEIGPALDASPDTYKPQITELQTLIKRVIDLDVRIRVCEDQNNAVTPKDFTRAAPSHTAPKPSVVTQDKNRLIKAYRENTRNYKAP